jgi:hypothetical protein
MNKFENDSRRLTWFLAFLLAAFLAGCGGGGDGNNGFLGAGNAPGKGTGVGGLGHGPAPVNLGAAGNFIILAESSIVDVGPSAVTGNVGLSPATGAGIGLTCAEVTGVVNDVDNTGPAPCTIMAASPLTTATNNKHTAYTDAKSRAPDYTELGAGNIGGLNLAPATYKWGTGVLIPSNLKLTGGPNDVWIFQIAQGLTVSPGVQIILVGGALPQNIYWATFAAASLDTTSVFKGTILSQTSITMKTGATINGRLLADTAVALDHNTVAP